MKHFKGVFEGTPRRLYTYSRMEPLPPAPQRKAMVIPIREHPAPAQKAQQHSNGVKHPNAKCDIVHGKRMLLGSKVQSADELRKLFAQGFFYFQFSDELGCSRIMRCSRDTELEWLIDKENSYVRITVQPCTNT